MTRGSFFREAGVEERMKGMSGYGKWVAGRKTKWITLAVWIVIVGALTLLWPSVNSQVVNNAQNLPDDSQSVRAAAVAEQEFPAGSGVPALLVWHKEGGLSDEDLIHIIAVYGKLEQQPLPHQNYVPPLGQLRRRRCRLPCLRTAAHWSHRCSSTSPQTVISSVRP